MSLCADYSLVGLHHDSVIVDTGGYAFDWQNQAK